MQPEDIFVAVFILFVVLNFMGFGWYYRRRERREKLQKRIKDSKPCLFY
jgi:uncharacterized membrane protein